MPTPINKNTVIHSTEEALKLIDDAAKDVDQHPDPQVAKATLTRLLNDMQKTPPKNKTAAARILLRIGKFLKIKAYRAIIKSLSIYMAFAEWIGRIVSVGGAIALTTQNVPSYPVMTTITLGSVVGSLLAQHFRRELQIHKVRLNKYNALKYERNTNVKLKNNNVY